jgi:hypothetical protein
LPARLAARAALAVAGRPLTEDLLGGVTGLAVDAVRGGLGKLTAARLFAATVDGGHRPRHALLAEAVARTPGAADDESLAAEVAGHWAAAGRTAEELPARVLAARSAERVFGYVPPRDPGPHPSSGTRTICGGSCVITRPTTINTGRTAHARRSRAGGLINEYHLVA